MSGDRCNRAELAARFKLPIYTISACDFQKLAGVRTQDGPPQVGALMSTHTHCESFSLLSGQCHAFLRHSCACKMDHHRWSTRLCAHRKMLSSPWTVSHFSLRERGKRGIPSPCTCSLDGQQLLDLALHGQKFDAHSGPSPQIIRFILIGVYLYMTNIWCFLRPFTSYQSEYFDWRFLFSVATHRCGMT